MAEVIEAYENKIERIGLIPSDGGKFEVQVNDELVYSKLATGRHLEAGEIVPLIRSHLETAGNP